MDPIKFDASGFFCYPDFSVSDQKKLPKFKKTSKNGLYKIHNIKTRNKAAILPHIQMNLETKAMQIGCHLPNAQKNQEKDISEVSTEG